MAKDDLDLDALGLSDEELGLGSSGSGSGGGGGGGPGGASSAPAGRKRRGWLLFLLGVVIGGAAALLAPRYLAPYLPPAMTGDGERVEGEVLGKRMEDDRLLLTVETPRGAVLATFRDKVAEIDLLVEEGDSVALGLGRYRPFVDDPEVAGVRKAPGAVRSGADRAREVPDPEPAAGAEPSDAEPAEPDTGAAQPEAGREGSA